MKGIELILPNTSCSHLASHLNVKSVIDTYMSKCTLCPPTD